VRPDSSFFVRQNKIRFVSRTKELSVNILKVIKINYIPLKPLPCIFSGGGEECADDPATKWKRWKGIERKGKRAEGKGKVNCTRHGSWAGRLGNGSAAGPPPAGVEPDPCWGRGHRQPATGRGCSECVDLREASAPWRLGGAQLLARGAGSDGRAAW